MWFGWGTSSRSCCFPLATSDSAALSTPIISTFFFVDNKVEGFSDWAELLTKDCCLDVIVETARERTGVISSRWWRAVAAEMLSSSQHFRKPLPASEHAATGFWSRCFLKWGINPSAVAPAGATVFVGFWRQWFHHGFFALVITPAPYRGEHLLVFI